MPYRATRQLKEGEDKQQEVFLAQLAKYPHVGAACLKAGVKHSLYKSWLYGHEGAEFHQRVEDALSESHGRIIAEAFDAALGRGEFKELRLDNRARILTKLMTDITPELTGRYFETGRNTQIRSIETVFTQNVPLPASFDDMPEATFVDVKAVAD